MAPSSTPHDAPSPSQLSELATFASTLADAARKVILPFWRRPIEVVSKHEPDRPIAESPVTVADRNAEAAMRTLIEGRYPDHGIYGEEHGAIRTDAEYVWVLDPIDGTKSFITGKPLFGTLVACLYRGVPVVGLIDQCVLNERWVGVAGVGTTLNGKPVRADGCGKLGEAMMYATTPHMFAPGEEETKFEEMCGAVLRPLYGADCYAYALVASGFGADVVVEADLGLYDYCALVPVVEGAGGVMTAWDGTRLTLQDHEKNGGRVVACANRGLHEEAVQILGRPYSSGGAILARALAKVCRADVLPALAAGIVLGVAVSRRK